MLSVLPASVSLGAVGATQVLAVTETGYTGSFTETNTCTSGTTVATFSGSSAAGPAWNETVTGAAAGTCSATFMDSFGQHVMVPITVTVSGFTIQSHQRR